MLRKDLRRAAEKVLQALEATGFALLFEALMASRDKPDRSGFLPAFSEFVRLYERFGEEEKELISILDIGFLHDAKFWTTLMTTDDFRAQDIYEHFQSIRFAQEHLPKVLSLVARESDQISEAKKKGEKPKANGLSQLSITVIEERQQSSPERLVLALQSIDGLYRACAQVMDESEDDLCVIACDSGSDKSFDFLGVAKIVESVKQVILSFWDRVVYFREDKTERRLDLIAQSLPILDQIASMKDSGKLEPERAELIKRQVIDSVTKFANAGITIPEIDKFTVYNPRQLMKPSPKLLVASKEARPEADKGEQESKEARPLQIDDPEFQAYMEKMAKGFLERKAQSANASSPEHTEELDDEPKKTMDSNEE